MPPPLVQGPDATLAMVVSVTCLSDVEVLVESFSPEQLMAGGEMAYLSMVVIWLTRGYSTGEVLVNGVENHPILSLSKISPETAAFLESEGY
ncbi:hypothetical protein [Kibdelosporangium persicum]|uniref:hypothetical protein n=1 Tax=Kibdelosporangium persicum TaxID=2698649 RepID=UPI001564887A|nr:hypothetical protein [Kibdelosporangium persicum]